MKPVTILAVLLLVLGVVAFSYQGFTYTTKEKIVDIGPLEVTTENTETFPLPPILGAVAIIGGLGLLILGRKKS